MDNLEIAKLLRKMAAAYTILGDPPAGRQGNRFKIIAYDNAATAVEHATSELKDLWEEGKLDTVPGLGPAIISHLDELFRKGKSAHFEATLKKVNPAIFPLLDVPGLGPKKAAKLVSQLHLRSLDDLKKAAREHKIASLETFGNKSEEVILSNIERLEKGAIKERRLLLPQADEIADEIIDYLAVKADKLGSLRRRVATIGDVDLAVATNQPIEVIERFVNYPKKVSLIERGPTGASILLASGRQADLRVSKPREYGAMLQYFTGSKYHNIRLRELALKKHLSINEYGISGHRFATEESLYKFLGLDYIEPELREDNGEIEAAKAHKLPKLVELSQIHGDLQLHSNFDLQTSHDSGEDSMKELQEAAQKLGYDYIGVTDHNPSTTKHRPTQVMAKMRAQKEHVEHLNSSGHLPRVISLLEVDISADGSLPMPQNALAQLDGCLVSVHSSFGMDKKEMTKRVIGGLSNPVARILAHPTGRILQQRDGYELDWDVISRFCLEHDKALEINAHPSRLDLPDTLVREVVKRGVKLSLGTDSHKKDDLVNMKYGVSVARRGWAQEKNIINSWNYAKILAWFHQRG
ncbi:MAG: helix-hairpin-helix domain-containing protein [Patescibacteria group bacterium]|nr:helix-hairpin-helix domain-containing protein [Patescibacteria group bacterium]MCL5432323.1 helix-hairpin-helix domain-containing protein [Patescibacteria group bacterium]